MECKVCGSKWVANKYHKLCAKHNAERLREDKVSRGDVDEYGMSIKTKAMIEDDEKLYEKAFSLSNHKCEECGVELNTIFRDSDGRVVNRSRYAHRFPKSTYPRLRHEVWNIVNLCLPCHQKYDFGDAKSMRIYKESLILKESYGEK